MDKRDRFNAGYLIAVANLVNLFGEDTIARELLEQGGVTRGDMRACGFSDYDTVVLERLFDLNDRAAALAKEQGR